MHRVFSQVFELSGGEPADVVSAQRVKDFFAAIQSLNEEGLLLAYHDRSDGGLYAAMCEMAFAGRVSASILISNSKRVVTWLQRYSAKSWVQ